MKREKIPRGASCEGTTSLNAAGNVDLIPRRLSLVISGRQFAGINSDVGNATVVCTVTHTHMLDSSSSSSSRAQQ